MGSRAVALQYTEVLYDIHGFDFTKHTQAHSVCHGLPDGLPELLHVASVRLQSEVMTHIDMTHHAELAHEHSVASAPGSADTLCMPKQLNTTSLAHLYALLQSIMLLLQALLLSFPLAAPPLLISLCSLDVSSNSFLLLLQGQQPGMG